MPKNYQIRKEMTSNVKKNLSGYSPLLQKLLYYRGIKNKTEAEKFFNPNYDEDLNDPLLLKDIEKATKRILKAINKKERILIYSDYDADGIPGAVVLSDFFKKIGFSNFTNYIPHRNDEGFGLNVESLEDFKKNGVKLIITVDCGITDVLEVEKANKFGIDTIITDHHLAGDVLPKAVAIVNPNQKGDKYPFKSLCGSAVAYKLVQALIKIGDFQIMDGWEKWLLDMVGLATISDMVSLSGENRVFSYYGLLVLRKTSRPGLRNLYKESRLFPRNISEDDISFIITPKINAASRMDEAYTAYTLLASNDEAESIESAKRLIKLNNDRKILTATIVKSIKRKLSKKEIPPIIVSGNSSWKPSILGLVAGNIAEEFNCPVFLWGKNGSGEIRGSCRSDQSADVYELMQSLPEGFLEHFGGHKFSGGFGISKENIHFLEEKLLDIYKTKEVKEEEKVILIDEELKPDDVSWDLVKDLEKLAPFGVGNPKPIFMFKNIELPKIKSFGKHGEHLKFDFQSEGRKSLSAIKFFAGPDSFEKRLKTGQRVDLVATIEKSYFRNIPEIRLRIVDII